MITRRYPANPFLLMFAMLIVSSPQWANAQCVAYPDCQLVWSDEFDGSEVDTNKWEFMIGDGSVFGIPGWGNNERQYYRAENATVANGLLTITAKQEFFGGYNYTSARLRSLGRGDWTYGRFEARIKLPEGQGMWPAFWMLSSNPGLYGTWAASGEIDIMESLGQERERIYGTIHYGGSSPDNVFSGSETLLPFGTGGDFHTYAVEWEFGEIRWYLDGQLYSVRDNWFSTGGPFPAPFDVDFHLLLNLAVGGNFPGDPDATTVFPQDYVIDYVRVYSFTDEPPSPLAVFDTMEHGNPFGNGYFIFDGIGGGGLGSNSTDLPPEDGGSFSLQTGWGSGGTPGYFGGFGRTNPLDLSGLEKFSFWINPDAGQDYLIAINLQDDDNGDGEITQSDDEFEFGCVVSSTGPCAVSGGGWQKVTIPFTSFVDDNSVFAGGNGIFDPIAPGNGGNGRLINVVLAIVSNSGADVSFRTDYWVFEGPEPADSDLDGVADVTDNCTEVPNADQRDTDSDGFGNVCDADLDQNGFVNFLDLQLFRFVFGTIYPDADFDGNGFVGFEDLAVLSDQFGGSPGPSGDAQ